MNNMSKIIKGHNKKVTSKPCDQRQKCNCSKKAGCLSISTTYHLSTRDVPIRQQFQVTCGTYKLFQVKLKVVCFVVHTTILKYFTGLLNKISELLCKCCHANKFLLRNYTDNDFRQLGILSSSKS